MTEHVLKMEPFTMAMLKGLLNSMSPVSATMCGLNNVDMKRGRGVLDESGTRHCLWTNDGRRITVTVGAHGDVIVSLAKDADQEL